MPIRTLEKKGFTQLSVLVCVFCLIGLAVSELSVLTPEAQAIPAFARKYGVSCNVCHVPGFPKLNDFGNQFRDQGYQVGSDMDLPTYESITMGYFPVSFRTTVGYQIASVKSDGAGVTTGGFGFTGLDILSFGILHRDLSFGVVFTPGLGSAAFGTGGSDSDLEAAYIRVNRLEKYLGVKEEQGRYLLNLKVGKFEIDVPFSEKRSPTLNTPFVLYHYLPGTPYTATIGGTSTSSYLNSNTFALGDNSPGIELAGITKTSFTDGFFRYSLAGLSTNAFSGPLCPQSQQCGTGGRNINFYGHMTQSFGGYGIVTGHRIGVFGLYGNAPTTVNATCPTCISVGGTNQPFSRVGVDVSLTFDGQWNLFGAFMHGNDSRNLFVWQGVANAQGASWNGAFVQLDWYPNQLPFLGIPGLLMSYRYDVIRNTKQGDPSFAKNYNDVDSHTGMLRYYIHQSTRTDLAFHLEYNYYRTQGVGGGGGALNGQTTLVGLDFAY
jgi:hypothetical protein